MSERIFTRVNNQREHDIVYEPRSGTDMEKATLKRVPIHLYSKLCEMARKHGSRALLSHMFKQANSHIILLQDPNDMNSGHWISVTMNPKNKEIYFFSTYGGKPDVEKLEWMNDDDLQESGQDINIFNDGLKDMQEHGWEIHYNDYPYQKPNDKTAVCGIYTAAFIRSGLDPEEFEKETLNIARSGKNPAVFYFDAYFN